MSLPDHSSAPARVSRWERWSAAGVLVFAIGLAFVPVMQILIGQWLTNDTYSFGVLVPVISAYFMWMQRRQLRQIAIQPQPLEGLLLLTLCAGMLVAGRVVGVIGIQEAAMVLAVPATLWLLCGRKVVSALWFPLLYLLLMLPVWEILTDRFHYRFQLFSALLSEQLVSLIGIPVHRNGTYLELPNITLEVASVCSGVNFLVAVIAIGVPQAYLFLRGNGPRAAVIGFALSIAMLSNGLRIAIIAALSHYQLTQELHAPGHLLQGLFVSAIGIVTLQVAIGCLRNRYPIPPREWTAAVAPPARRLTRGKVLVAASLAGALLLAASVARPQGVALISDRPTAPAMPSWQLVEADWPSEFVQGGPTPNRGQLFQAGRTTVSLYTGALAYSDPNGSLGYRHVNVPTRTAISQMPVKTRDGSVLINSVSFRNGDQSNDVAYWYDLNGVVTAQVTTAKLSALWCFITGARPLPQLVVISRSRLLSVTDSGPDAFDAIALDVVDMMRRQP